jgi:hypothetical protein
MKFLFLLLLMLPLVSCSETQPEPISSQPEKEESKKELEDEKKKSDLENKKEIEQRERDELFVSLQKYVDTHYPNWKVKGVQRLSSILVSDDGTETNLYTVFMTDGKKNKIIRILKQEFILQDGTKSSEYNEPSNEVLKSMFTNESDQSKE